MDCAIDLYLLTAEFEKLLFRFSRAKNEAEIVQTISELERLEKYLLVSKDAITARRDANEKEVSANVCGLPRKE